jgi:hypothetical protein
VTCDGSSILRIGFSGHMLGLHVVLSTERDARIEIGGASFPRIEMQQGGPSCYQWPVSDACASLDRNAGWPILLFAILALTRKTRDSVGLNERIKKSDASEKPSPHKKRPNKEAEARVFPKSKQCGSTARDDCRSSQPSRTFAPLKKTSIRRLFVISTGICRSQPFFPPA